MRVCPSEVGGTLPAGAHCRKNPYKPYTATRAHAKRAKYIWSPAPCLRLGRAAGALKRVPTAIARLRAHVPVIVHDQTACAAMDTAPLAPGAARGAVCRIRGRLVMLVCPSHPHTSAHRQRARARDVYGEAGQAMVKRVGVLAGVFQQIRRDGAPVPSEGRDRMGAEAQASVVSGRRPTRRLTASPPGLGSCRSRFLQRAALPSPGMIFPAAHHLARRMATQGSEIRNGHE